MDEKNRETSDQQATQERQRRFEECISREVHQRVDRLTAGTIEQLTMDITDTHVRIHVTETLTFLKILGSLRLLRKTGVLEQAEYEELDHYILRLRNKGFPERPQKAEEKKERTLDSR